MSPCVTVCITNNYRNIVLLAKSPTGIQAHGRFYYLGRTDKGRMEPRGNRVKYCVGYKPGHCRGQLSEIWGMWAIEQS